jgi:23S rRNA-/tRNA-specific pseudouridylate synthase
MARSILYAPPHRGARETLAQFLARKFTYHDVSRWHLQIARGLVQVNDVVCVDAERVLAAKDRLRYAPPQELEPAVDVTFRVVADDEDFIVVSKSGNIPVSESGRYCRNVLVAVVAEELARGSSTHREPAAQRTRTETDHSTCARDTHTDALEVASVQDDAGPVPQLFTVHRLDKETSGLVVFAKSKAAAAHLGAQFAAHSSAEQGDDDGAAPEATTAVVKEYDTIMAGDLRQRPNSDVAGEKWVTDSDDGANDAPRTRWLELRAPIGREVDQRLDDGATGATRPKPTADDPLVNLRMLCVPPSALTRGVKRARTQFLPCSVASVIDGAVLTYARVRLFTGRTHQIRIHAAWADAPVLGDKMYTRGGVSVATDVYLARARGEVPVTIAECVERQAAAGSSAEAAAAAAEASTLLKSVVPRHFLHCSVLGFTHPRTGQQLRFEDPGMPRFVAEAPWLQSMRWEAAV